jgi:galactitol-specific phosphotransferase system IIC component
VQPEKVLSLIAVTFSGILIEVKAEQFLKAELPIEVTLSGILKVVKFLQPEKVPSLIIVRFSGILMEVKEVQPYNAELPIYVTFSGIFMEFKAEHP